MGARDISQDFLCLSALKDHFRMILLSKTFSIKNINWYNFWFKISTGFFVGYYLFCLSNLTFSRSIRLSVIHWPLLHFIILLHFLKLFIYDSLFRSIERNWHFVSVFFALLDLPKYFCTVIPCNPYPEFWVNTFCYLLMCLKTDGRESKSVDPHQTQRFAVSDLDLHCLLRPVCPSA